MAIIEHFEPFGSPGARITVRGLGADGAPLAEQLKRRKGQRAELRFDVSGTKQRVLVAADIIDSDYQEWQSGGLRDSVLDLWLKFEDPSGHAAILSLYESRSQIGLALGD